jgi:hypothetical protein
VLCVQYITDGENWPFLYIHTIHYFLYGVCAHTHTHTYRYIPPRVSPLPASPFSDRSYPAPWRTDGPLDARWQLRRIEFRFPFFIFPGEKGKWLWGWRRVWSNVERQPRLRHWPVIASSRCTPIVVLLILPRPLQSANVYFALRVIDVRSHFAE